MYARIGVVDATVFSGQSPPTVLRSANQWPSRGGRSMARDLEKGHVVTVVGQEGQNVLVAVQMVGFPKGFQLSPGARVMLVSTPSGIGVGPIVRAW
jgi:hypothetical protein